jgi:hydrogenase maturation factor HypF (carbamoyltransferase family)
MTQRREKNERKYSRHLEREFIFPKLGYLYGNGVILTIKGISGSFHQATKRPVKNKEINTQRSLIRRDQIPYLNLKPL